MTKEVLITISGLHMGVEQDETLDENLDDGPIEVVSTGNYYEKNGKCYLFFEEIAEGFQEVTKTQIKWTKNKSLEVSKKGLSNMNLFFEKNKKNRCFYNTPFGALNLGIYTTELKVDETEDNIDILVEYLMDVNYEPLAECEIRINIKPRDSKKFSLV